MQPRSRTMPPPSREKRPPSRGSRPGQRETRHRLHGPPWRSRETPSTLRETRTGLRSAQARSRRTRRGSRAKRHGLRGTRHRSRASGAPARPRPGRERCGPGREGCSSGRGKGRHACIGCGSGCEPGDPDRVGRGRPRVGRGPVIIRHARRRLRAQARVRRLRRHLPHFFSALASARSHVLFRRSAAAARAITPTKCRARSQIRRRPRFCLCEGRRGRPEGETRR